MDVAIAGAVVVVVEGGVVVVVEAGEVVKRACEEEDEDPLAGLVRFESRTIALSFCGVGRGTPCFLSGTLARSTGLPIPTPRFRSFGSPSITPNTPQTQPNTENASLALGIPLAFQTRQPSIACVQAFNKASDQPPSRARNIAKGTLAVVAHGGVHSDHDHRRRAQRYPVKAAMKSSTHLSHVRPASDIHRPISLISSTHRLHLLNALCSSCVFDFRRPLPLIVASLRLRLQTP